MNSKKDDVITFKHCQKWLLIKNIFESGEDINKVDFDYQNGDSNDKEESMYKVVIIRNRCQRNNK